MEKEKITLDRFGEIMNEMMTKSYVAMLIEMPEGTQEPQIRGTGISTLDFYVLMAAIRPVFVALIKDAGGPQAIDAEGMIDRIWKILRGDILEQLEGL